MNRGKLKVESCCCFVLETGVEDEGKERKGDARPNEEPKRQGKVGTETKEGVETKGGGFDMPQR